MPTPNTLPPELKDSFARSNIFLEKIAQNTNEVSKNVMAALKANSKQFAKEDKDKETTSKDNIFSRMSKAFTNPFKGIGNSLSSAISNLKSTFSSINPFKFIGNITEKFSKTKENFKKVIGKDAESLKNKFYENWYNPAKVAAIQWWVSNNLWKKENKRLVKKAEKEERKRNGGGLIFKGPTNYELEGRYYRIWNKPAKVAKIWANEFNKSTKNNKLPQKMKGPEATMGQLIASVSKDISKISNAVTFFLTGPGLGIALAIGLTPPILMLSAAIVGAVWLICNTIEKLIGPIITPIKSILTSMNSLVTRVTSIADNILKIFDSPISTIASGVKSVVGKVKDKLTDNGKVNEKLGINDMFYRAYQEWTTNYLTPIKSDVSNIAHKKQATINFIPLFNLFNKGFAAPLFQRYQKFDEKAFKFFESKEEESFVNKLAMAKERNTAKAYELLGKTGAAIKDGFKSVYTDLKSIFSSNNQPSTAIIPENSFQELTRSFNDMKTDTIKILGEIKTAVIEISKNRIQIGNELTQAAVGTGAPSDTKLQPLNVVVNQNNNNEKIVEILNHMKTSVDSIVTNTSIDNLTQKPVQNNSTWLLNDNQ